MTKKLRLAIAVGALLALGAGCAKPAGQPPAAGAPEGESPPAESAAAEAVDLSAWSTPTPENPAEPCPAQFIVVPSSSSVQEHLAEFAGPPTQAAAAYNEEGNLYISFANFSPGATKDDVLWTAAGDPGQVVAVMTLSAKNARFVPGFYVNNASTQGNLMVSSVGIGYAREGSTGGVDFLESETSGVKITELTSDRVCGVAQINDGYAKITGAFSAAIVQ